MDRLRFGTAGRPISTGKPGTAEGVKRVRELNLDSMELEFVRGVNITKDKTLEISKEARKNDVVLSVHGPYYINLNSLDKAITHASINRILESARIGFLCSAFSLTFHAAYYMKLEKSFVYEKVKKEIKFIVDTLKHEGNKIFIRPELTGKESQFGDLNELLKLSQEIEQVLPCIDFSHYHARYNGKFNSYKEFAYILEQIEKVLGKNALSNMHIHVSGIEYTAKGERNHVDLKESDLNYKDLMKVFKDFKIKGTVISESPSIEQDALLMKKTYDNL